MISPGFFSFFNAQRGLIAAQMALNTVNHNVSNANTPGYSRQRVDMQAATPYTFPSLQGGIIDPGQLGQGVDVIGVSRTRDRFIDAQYRTENGILGMNTNIRDILQQLEGVLAEPSNGSINTSLQNLFDAAQELSLHPESQAVRADFLQQAVDVVTIFRQQANQLATMRQNLVGDPSVAGSFSTSRLAINVDDVNTKLESITSINRQIITIVASGAEPNDLYDQRDRLLDELSQLVDIQVTDKANGQIDLSIGGELMIRGAQQIDSLEVLQNPGPAPAPTDVPALVRTVNGAVVLNNGAGSEITSGKIKGILDIAGNDPTLSTIYGTLSQLNSLVNEIATQINTVQLAGRDQSGAIATEPIFTLNAGASLSIFRWEVNTDVLDDPSLIATAIDDALAPGGYAGDGDGRNALLMAQLRDGAFAALGNQSYVDYFNGLVSNLGIDSRAYQDRTQSQASLISNLDLRRDAISGVNTDEEMIDMLRFQRAFEASSRLISAFDDMFKTIIGMV